ncbi:hypothetical protein [Flavobacterium sp.]|uniref:hypothetical protein n=1 Tax=Flavobacterium sp. TaxID=239 RepID=UPI0025DCC99E|nr:hypothetical protein [Flavobacterium sp.]
MDATYYQTIANSTAHRKCRDDQRDFIFNHCEYLPDLLQISYNTTDKNHHKACWILELVFEERLALIQSHLSDFCDNLKHFTSDSAIRSLSKICLFLAQSKTLKLTEIQEEQIIEACLDWLIQTDKAANAAYSMRALYFLGKRQPWINSELKLILSREFENQTPGYRSAVKDLLKRLR